MDVDDSADVVERGPKMEALFAKSDQLTTSFYAQLPLEVKQALKSSGL